MLGSGVQDDNDTHTHTHTHTHAQGGTVSRSETPGAFSGLPATIERMAPVRQSMTYSGLGKAIFWVVLR